MQKQDKYIYPAVFSFYDDDKIGITFPDLPGCVSCGDDIPDAMHMATDALGLHLLGMEDDGDEIPAPSDVFEIKKQLKPNQILTLIEVFMPRIRDSVNNKAVNKTVTLPQWLISAGREENINFSQTLQDALMEKLGIHREIKRRKYKSKQYA
ncbi:MAG: type II toxin-antitoxin system HicB family antitoxin [Synergistaceae bacterium]|nr:type II toxin-antitoxin system HicB family antitoxin [Synergistaceae bacterium]MBR0075145.1 type II toxin-antitoxin system HicB family antitoxin [Synergistaceae bacterium]MBR0079427.1 type II toxin-antitoxin system HicB family antitoxin [Synergistaceae bacterium]MBR0234690.1 type II toxin-antitoxin system HicB family antitoxin [Synergistaceae bacterium]